MINSCITYIKDSYREEISDKEAKFLLGKFLMENGVLDAFISYYKMHWKNKHFATINDVLYDCIRNLHRTNVPLSQLFNYSDVSFSWNSLYGITVMVAGSRLVDWYPIHRKWEKLITLDIDIKR